MNLKIWRLILLWSLGLGTWIFSPAASAQTQPASPPAQDPLMNLMLSQPRVELGLVTVMSSFDPPVVRPGEETIYRVTVTALEQSVELPSEIDVLPSLELRPGAHGQILQLAEGKQIPLTTFNYRARPSSSGEFIVASFGVKVYGKPMTVPGVSLQVVDKPADAALAGQMLLLAFPSTQILQQVQLTGQDFIVDQSSVRQSVPTLPFGGSNVVTFVYETTLTPIASGKIAVSAQAYTAGSYLTPQLVITGTAPIPGGLPQYRLLESDPVQLTVRPLPKEGELPGFTGGIGNFTLDPPKLNTNALRVGDPVRLTVAVRKNGEGANLSRLAPPPSPASQEWEVLTAVPDTAPPQVIEAQGFAAFHYTLVPLSEQVRATPAIPFSFFDPTTGKYSDLTIPPVPVSVKAGALGADLRTLLQTNAALSDAEEELSLRGLASNPGRSTSSLVPWQEQPWFPLVQLCPATAFLGLWGWDRRRRYLEQHPHILRNRRARRALRREWRSAREAARARDGVSFATAAVNAMRVASAPHYPAEPRALVGADVIQLLGNGSGLANHDTELVRRFFTVADVSRFAAGPADASALLNLQAELDQLLKRLEARLS